MKLHKILPIIFLIIAMMISCSQETVINENISGEATTPDTKICVNIKTENSRTVRPEITKWEITVTNKSDANLTFSRTIDGKATSATFVNITDGEYEITVRGIHEDSNRKTIILTANPTFEVKPNTVNVCEIIPEDYFPNPIINNDGTFSTPAGNLSIQISGLKDLFTEGETLLLTCTKLPETNNESNTTCDLIFNEEGKTSSVISEIPVGSYKIEITHNDEAKTKTKVNLVKDPLVNIYADATTDINWKWNYDIDAIKEHNALKEVKIPVWNKESSSSNDYDGTFNTSFGLIGADALFAEPIWDEEKTYMFTVEVADSTSPTGGDPINYSANIPASKLEFINCTYDESDDLWVLSGTSEMKGFSSNNLYEPEVQPEYYCYVLRNLSASETKEYKFTCSSRLSQDFAVATVGEQNDQNKQKYLFYITESDGYNIKSFKIEGEGGDFDDGTQHFTLGQISAIYAKGDQLYIAITENNNYTTANIYTGIINEKGELASFGENNQPDPILSLGISDFTNETILNSGFYNPAFAISDMYINGDKSKLYVTASCVNYNGNSWNNNQYYGFYHSFGGLFVYELDEAGNLKKDDDGSITVESYGINNNEITTIDPETENDIDPNPFLQKPTDGSDNYEVESNIIQATSDDSPYFAGPRYIIPSGNDLLIVDSGFYGMYKSEYKQLTDCEKRNRIFTFNINENNNESEGLIFNSITTLDDSISFDYDYLTSSSLY